MRHHQDAMPTSPKDLAFLARRDRRLRQGHRGSPGRCRFAARADGFGGLARIVVGQQVSVASAAAIWAGSQAAFPDFVAAAILVGRTMTRFARRGLSVPKIRTLRAVAAACRDGLDFDRLATLPGRRGARPPDRDQGHRPVDRRHLSAVLPRSRRYLSGRRPGAAQRGRRRLRSRRTAAADRRARRRSPRNGRPGGVSRRGSSGPIIGRLGKGRRCRFDDRRTPNSTGQRRPGKASCRVPPWLWRRRQRPDRHRPALGADAARHRVRLAACAGALRRGADGPPMVSALGRSTCI